MSRPVSILVIAYGNPLRRDDGAGLALADRLVQQWQTKGISVQQITTHQLVPELAAEIADANASHIIFVDAESAASHFEIRVGRVQTSEAALALGHHFTPNLVMALAQHLYDVHLPAWIITIPGCDFEHGEEFSPGVSKLLSESTWVADVVADMVERPSNQNT